MSAPRLARGLAGPTMRGRQARLIVGGIIGLATGFAGLFIGTLTLFLKPIAQDFGWSRTDISAGIVMSMMGLAIGSPIQGRLIDRFGARRVIAGSIVAFAAAVLLLADLPNNRLAFGLTCLAIGALGTATGPNGYLSLLPAWFDRRLGLALAGAMIGVGLGGTLLAPLAETLIRAGGWRHAYQALAVIALVGGFIALAVGAVGSPPRTPSIVGVAAGALSGLSFREGLRDWRMPVLMAAVGIGGAAGLGMTFHIAAMLDDRGFGHAQVASIVALSGAGLLAGRLVGGPLLDEIPTRYVGACAFLTGAVATILLALNLTQAFPILALGAFLLGLSLGTEGDLVAFAVRRYFGTRAFAGLYGCVFMAYSIGSVIGVILCGRAYDAFGDYFVAGIVCAIGFLVAAGLMLTLDQYRFAISEPAAA